MPDAPPEEGVEKIKGHNYFIATVTRPPKVYRGNPFQVEVGLAYGGSWPADKPIELFRFANRVPLLFQRGACGITEAIVKHRLAELPPLAAEGLAPGRPDGAPRPHREVWVPFTSEAKEAVAHYPEIIAGDPARARRSAAASSPRTSARSSTPTTRRSARSIFELYIQEVAQAIGKITGQEPGADQARVPPPRRPGDGGGPERGRTRRSRSSRSEAPRRRAGRATSLTRATRTQSKSDGAGSTRVSKKTAQQDREARRVGASAR